MSHLLKENTFSSEDSEFYELYFFLQFIMENTSFPFEYRFKATGKLTGRYTQYL